MSRILTEFSEYEDELLELHIFKRKQYVSEVLESLVQRLRRVKTKFTFSCDDVD